MSLILNVLVGNITTSVGNITTTAAGGGGGMEYHTAAEIFHGVFMMMSFFALLWVVGKISVFLKMPGLVGEIVVGMIMGPNLLDFVPYYNGLVVLGDIGLVLLVLEAGVEVDMGVLKVVGGKGLAVAVFGSMLPLGIGTGLAFLIHGTSISTMTAVAIGACFAPTSMGIALTVLKNAGFLNTPTGQLIIAAAVLDDVIALMLLSVLQELTGDVSILMIIWVIAVSPILILVFGFISIYISPHFIRFCMDRFDIKYHEYVILLILFGAMLALVPMCFYVKSSYLLGAFLAGILVCGDHTIHHVWDKQMKRIMFWMLRIFFACTIGFAVPISDFMTDLKIVTDALIYFVAVIGKVATGIFATSRPITIHEFCMIAFAMSAWGEFAFILATQAYGTGIITRDTMTSILMAVLFSVMIAPLLLYLDLRLMKQKKEQYLLNKREETMMSIQTSISRQQKTPVIISVNSQDSDTTHAIVGSIHSVYYCIHTKTMGKWGHQNRLLNSLYKLHLEIIDFRSFNEPQEKFTNIVVQNIFYVKDTTLSLVASGKLNIQSKKKLSVRVKDILSSIHFALDDKQATVVISRWLPGIKQTDDTSEVSHSSSKDQQTIPLEKQKSLKYVRNKAYKQARIALSYHKLPGLANLDLDNINKMESITGSHMSDQKQQTIPLQKPRRDLIHDTASDALVALIDEENEDNTMSLDILYGGDHAHELRGPNTPSVEMSGNVNHSALFDATTPVVTSAGPNTPLLKKDKEKGGV